MRISQAPPSLLALLLVTLPSTVTAGPFPKDALHDLGFSYLMDRACISYCGMDNQYCCTTGQACYTVGLIAGCSAAAAAPLTVGAGAGYVVYTYTTTQVDLVTRTMTSTSYYQAAPTTAVVAPAPTVAGTPAICTVQGQTSCGTICCASFQVCGSPNQCVPRPESSFFPVVPVPVPTAAAPTATAGTFTAPFRPTSSGVLTATFTVPATTTAPFLSPATASGSAFPTPIAIASGGGLSPGAIAGIVIGVIAGIMLLILLCFCCIVKAGFDGLLAIFGLGKGRKRSTERIETVEHYSRHGSAAGGSRRESHGGWFGGKPSRVDSSRKKKSSGFGGLGAVGAGLAGLALVLGLKRKHDKEKPARSDISSSYYTDSYTGTSASSASSDRRTRDSRRPPPPR